MNDNFCTFEQSKALKELGFRHPNNQHYTPQDFDYPMKFQALRFFREKFGLFGVVVASGKYNSMFSFIVTFMNTKEKIFNGDFETYELAESALIDKLIVLAGEKK